jgi:hypothetical protein
MKISFGSALMGVFLCGCASMMQSSGTILDRDDEFLNARVVEVKDNQIQGLQFNPKLILKENKAPEYLLVIVASSSKAPSIKTGRPSFYVVAGNERFSYTQVSETPGQVNCERNEYSSTGKICYQTAEYRVNRKLFDALDRANYEAKFRVDGENMTIDTSFTNEAAKKVIKTFYDTYVKNGVHEPPEK